MPSHSQTNQMEGIDVNRLIPRMRREYDEWPRLSLTVPQAAKLWSADEHTCVAAFRALVRVGFLAERGDGRFVRRDHWHQHWCPSHRAVA